MSPNRFLQALRHPLSALAGAALFALAALTLICASEDVRARLDAAADDPAQISDRALARSFNRDVAEREIRAALAAGDTDLAQSFLELAADRGVRVDPALAEQVQQISARQATFTSKAGRFVHGLWTGEPSDLASLAGTAVGDLFVFGDIRDAAREGTRYLRRARMPILGSSVLPVSGLLSPRQPMSAPALPRRNASACRSPRRRAVAAG